MLRDKLKRWLLGAIILTASGIAVRQAIIQSAQTEGITCADAQKVVNSLQRQDSAYLIPFVDKIVPGACNLNYEVKCSILPDGSLCEQGRKYGPGHGGVVCPSNPNSQDPCVIDPCNIDDGQPVPCRSEDGWFSSGRYDPDTINTKLLLKQLYHKLEHEGLANTLPNEQE